MDDHGGGTGSGGDDQVTSHPLHLQHAHPPNVVSPLFLHPGEHPQHNQQQHQQQQNLSTRPVQHRQHHQYESLASLFLQHPSTSSSFGIEGECHTNNFKGDDNESWFQGSSSNDDNDSIDSIDNTTALLNDGNRKRKLFRSFLAWSSIMSDSPRDIIVGMVGIVTVGIILGLIFPSSSSSASTSSSNNSSWNILSNILGYTYCVSWTCSFYPQIITNWYTPTEARKGVSLDFCVWNIVGFVCYAIYTTSFRFSSVVREEYAHRFGDGNTTTTAAANTNYSTMFAYYDGNNTTTKNNDDEDAVAVAVPQVQINDVAFAWHAHTKWIYLPCEHSHSPMQRDKNMTQWNVFVALKSQKKQDTGRVGNFLSGFPPTESCTLPTLGNTVTLT